MKIVCFGDSLTFGSIGYSYIRFLKTKAHIINKGINGDTTICTYRRFSHYLNRPQHQNVNLYILAIGTNDLLLPYMSTLSPIWKFKMRTRISYKKCISNDSNFEMEYENYLIQLKKYNKPAIIVGLPIIQLKDYPMNLVYKRNKILKKLASKYGVPFIDTTSIQHSISTRITSSYSWRLKILRRDVDDCLMLLFPFTKDIFSKIRRLELTVDGVHYNSLSAKKIAAAIDQAILEYTFTS